MRVLASIGAQGAFRHQLGLPALHTPSMFLAGSLPLVCRWNTAAGLLALAFRRSLPHLGGDMQLLLFVCMFY